MSRPVWVIVGRLPDPAFGVKTSVDEEWLASDIVYTVRELAERQRQRLEESVKPGETRYYEVKEMVLDDERTAEGT